MKRKFSKQFNIKEDADPTESIKILYRQLKDITDDLQTALDNGISISDNLQMEYVTQRLNSGVEFKVSRSRLNRVKGAYPVHSDGSTISSFKSRFDAEGNLNVTVEFSPTPASITFLIVGE